MILPRRQRNGHRSLVIMNPFAWCPAPLMQSWFGPESRAVPGNGIMVAVRQPDKEGGKDYACTVAHAAGERAELAVVSA